MIKIFRFILAPALAPYKQKPMNILTRVTINNVTIKK